MLYHLYTIYNTIYILYTKPSIYHILYHLYTIYYTIYYILCHVYSIPFIYYTSIYCILHHIYYILYHLLWRRTEWASLDFDVIEILEQISIERQLHRLTNKACPSFQNESFLKATYPLEIIKMQSVISYDKCSRLVLCLKWNRGLTAWYEPKETHCGKSQYLACLCSSLNPSQVISLFEANGQRHQMGFLKVPFPLSYFLT